MNFGTPTKTLNKSYEEEKVEVLPSPYQLKIKKAEPTNYIENNVWVISP